MRQRSEKRKQDTEEAAAKRKEQEEKWEARQAELKAEQERRMAEEAKTPPRREYLGLMDAVKNLLRFYVDTQPREHQGKAYQIVAEFSEIPFCGDGVGDSYQAFDKDEILEAWRDLVEAFADWGGKIVTEEYFQENA